VRGCNELHYYRFFLLFFPCENDDAASNHKKVLVIALVVSIAVVCGLLVAGILLIRAQRKRAGKI
jgi:hypothetical protein